MVDFKGLDEHSLRKPRGNALTSGLGALKEGRLVSTIKKADTRVPAKRLAIRTSFY
ncbi:hypothetical protein THF1C08_460003 [Vibrio jasicida]|uniref:Uncharacterized protein n=1 Tax=Vibrio jasicida TaxID=766224 RepID=A0AAU9QSK7_9VIBR|nr:hypothetical protein THF1C08_460003 [Vibrio jasicida]CAH1601052.1 hypothetical protein THF1A12_460003 [Vibrio jasicida]